MHYIGVDLGTSSLKCLLIDDAQHIIAQASTPLSVSRPHPGWSEQDPGSWITALEHTLLALKTSHAREFAQTKALSFSGHMHGATVLDASGSPLRPCILWNDVRSAHEAAQLDALPEFRAQSANIVFPGFTAPKLQWMREHEPEIFSKIHKVLLPKDYLRYVLSGDYVADLSDAAGTAWLNVEHRCWSETLLSHTGLSIDQMPVLAEGCDAVSRMSALWSDKLGFDTPPILGAGAGDNAASAIALGTVSDGAAFVSLGTSGVVFAANDGYRPQPDSAVHTFCHALPDRWHQMGVILSATDCLNWFSNLCGQAVPDLLQASQGAQLTAHSPFFLPYLSGERTPHNLARAMGGFMGLSHQHGAPEMGYAVLEGVAFALRDNLAALQSTGTRIDALLAVGGGARSAHWLQLLANVLDTPIETGSDAQHGAAMGAARLAILAHGEQRIDEVCTAPPRSQRYIPQPSALHDERYAQFRALFPATLSALS